VLFHKYTIAVPYPTFEEEYKKMVAYIESIHTENQKIKLAVFADFDCLLIKIVCDETISNSIANYILGNHFTATKEIIFKEV